MTIDMRIDSVVYVHIEVCVDNHIVVRRVGRYELRSAPFDWTYVKVLVDI